jgi:hypothetical protein
MENKENLILGGMAVMFVWLALLSYNVLSSGASSSTIAQARAISSNPSGEQAAIKPTNTQTQPQQAQQQPEVDPAKAATLILKEKAFDFGPLQEGEKVEHVFEFTNTSSNPLTISNAKGSCGCTVPEWPKEPIAPGKKGEIKVKYDSKGKKGLQNKTVTLTANTIPSNTTLTIKADVIKTEDEEEASK